MKLSAHEVNNMDDTVATNDYVRLEMLSQQLKELEQSINMADEQAEHAQLAKTMLEELKTTDTQQELLVPIGNATFLSVKASDVKTVKVGVGANVVVDKTVAEAIERINNQLTEVRAYQEKSAHLYEQVVSQALELQEKIEKEYKQQ